MAKFKVGDVIQGIDNFHGLEKATVMRVDDKNYYLKIMCGTAIIPLSAENNYQLYDNKTIKNAYHRPFRL